MWFFFIYFDFISYLESESSAGKLFTVCTMSIQARPTHNIFGVIVPGGGDPPTIFS